MRLLLCLASCLRVFRSRSKTSSGWNRRGAKGTSAVDGPKSAQAVRYPGSRCGGRVGDRAMSRAYSLDACVARSAVWNGNFSMIGFLRGKLVAKLPPQLVMDVGGVGYELDAPMSTF